MAHPLLTVGGTMPKQLVLDITEGETGGEPETRVFPGSPITIGAGVGNTIRLDDPRVAPQHGLLFFTGSHIKYMSCAQAASSPWQPEILNLAEGASIQIGPFQLAPRIQDRKDPFGPPVESPTGLAMLADEMDTVFRSVALTTCAISNDNPGAKMGIAVRAMRLLDVVAALASDIRRNHLAVWTSSDLGPVAERPCDPLLITDYLLDPNGSTLCLGDFRERFVNLARWEQLVMSLPLVRACS